MIGTKIEHEKNKKSVLSTKRLNFLLKTIY